MQINMKKLKIMIGIFMSAGILSACTSINEQNSLKKAEVDTYLDMESVGQSIDSVNLDQEGNEEAGRQLTNEELQEFTYLINQVDNNGFLLSEYTDPKNVDLDQVLYNGAGIQRESMTQMETNAYLKATGNSEITTDCIRLTKRQIDEFLQKKMGIEMDDITKSFSWVYLSEYDCYIKENGDTNRTVFTCVNGRQVGENKYQLEVAAKEGLVSGCEVQINKNGDNYRFISNKWKDVPYTKDIWVMEDQTFPFHLEECGDVTFTTYKPDISVSMFADVTFALVKEGKTIFEFPSMEENDIREKIFFQKVKAVGFKDYDGDGLKDVIIINQYLSSVGTSSDQMYEEVRVYRYKNKEQKFILDWDACDFLNSNHITNSIAEVMEYLPTSQNQGIESKTITMEEACQIVLNKYFSNDLQEKNYDDGKLSVVLSRWERPWGDEVNNRYGETKLFYDSVTDAEYLFGCYRIYYEQDQKTVFATQTMGWYHVNCETGEVFEQSEIE